MIVPEHYKLMSAIDGALEALDNYSDVIDGDDGLPHPNHAMIALMELRAAVEEYRRLHESPKDGRTL